MQAEASLCPDVDLRQDIVVCTEQEVQPDSMPISLSCMDPAAIGISVQQRELEVGTYVGG